MYQPWYLPALYTPANSELKKLAKIVNNQRKEDIWRVVLCTEDSVMERDVSVALEHIRQLLQIMDPKSQVCTFVRARNTEVFERLLKLEGIEKITGFVIPKADPDEFPMYADQVVGTDFRLMPILESPLTWDSYYRNDLRAVFDSSRYRDHIDCVRIGANDLMGHLSLRRPTRTFTIYDLSVGAVIFAIVNEFRGLSGFPVTAPVFECYAEEYDGLFRREAEQNVANGLFGQTVINPRHLPLLYDMYRPSREDVENARAVLKRDHAVKGQNGRMDEPATHAPWAKVIIELYDLLGYSDTNQPTDIF